MPHPAKLLSVATAVPPHVLMQTEVAEIAARMFGGRFSGFERMAKVFGTAGIRKRHSVMPLDWFETPRGWPERTAAYLGGALDLFCQSASAALDEAGVKASEVDVVVTVSSTGIATPSLEAHALTRMGFSPSIQRVPVFGLGCGGGAAGFAIASRLAAAQPGSTVLLVVVELCTLAFRLDELTKANMVATALFGDGAAACVLRAQIEGGLATVEASAQHTWPDTLDIMGWRVDPQGFGVIFAQAIPPFAEANVGTAVRDMLAANDLAPADIERFLCHPGGVKVIHALERTLALPQGSLDHEREVLAEYGNMSAPTVLFVLDRQVRDEGLPDRSAILAMGPGFSAGLSVMKRAA